MKLKENEFLVKFYHNNQLMKEIVVYSEVDPELNIDKIVRLAILEANYPYELEEFGIENKVEVFWE